MKPRVLVAGILISVSVRTSGLGAQQAGSTQVAPPPPPATKLEAFTPKAGSLVTLGYDELGAIAKFAASGSVSVDVRELSADVGDAVRGLVVTVRESQYRNENAFVDAEEIDELLAAIDALMAIKTNPTTFVHFERSYSTKGELRLTAYNVTEGIRYSVRTGRVLRASVSTLTTGDLLKLRTMIAAGQAKLRALNAGPS